jgi:sensor histidine kinase YesM
MDRLFGSMDSVIWKEDGIALLDEDIVYNWPAKGKDDGAEISADRLTRLQAILASSRETEPAPRDQGMVFSYQRNESACCLDMKINDQRYAFVTGLDRRAMLADRMTFLSVYFAVFILLIPLLIATFYFFYSNINKPISSLVEGSEKIRSGLYGSQVEPFTKNQEIGQLVDNFNHMSRSLEESFRRIYVEEIAGRDATLKALQSQINPHFLNNTLEIINWKARMNGNEDVSEMISALSVMMNAALNRNNEMFIKLEEELTYVDAYLYIIKERFGDRFTFTSEVDPTLLDSSVPRLIIQPIVENAVEHGGDKTGSRWGKMRIFGSRRELHILVENNGSLSEEDREKIASLLSRAEKMAEERRMGERNLGDKSIDSSSIGIRNVHLRLRMLYGKESGLSIRDSGDGRTVSEIIICRQEQTNESNQSQMSM